MPNRALPEARHSQALAAIDRLLLLKLALSRGTLSRFLPTEIFNGSWAMGLFRKSPECAKSFSWFRARTLAWAVSRVRHAWLLLQALLNSISRHLLSVVSILAQFNRRS